MDLGPIGESDSFELVTADGGVQKQRHRVGMAGVKPQPQYTVDVKYVVRDTAGVVLDVSVNDLYPNKGEKTLSQRGRRQLTALQSTSLWWGRARWCAGWTRRC